MHANLARSTSAFLRTRRSLMRNAAAAFCLAGGLAPPALAAPAYGTPADEAAIRSAVRTFETGWNRHDMKAMFQAFAPDAEFVNIVGMHWQGLPMIQGAHQGMHDTIFKDVPNHIDDLQVKMLAADAAVAVVRWQKGGFTTPDGVAHPPSRDMMSMFFVKRAGQWRVGAAHNTPVDEVAARFDPALKK